jgi:hypothetical protein
MRGKIKLGAALGLVALTASIALPALASTARSHSHRTPYYIQWKPGTKLPKVPHGWMLMALPSQATQAALTVGQSVPWVKPSAAQPNSAGIVNLEAAPDYCDPSSVLKNLGPRWTVVAQSYATVRGITLSFDYGEGQSSSLEVGLSTTNKAGSFKASKTVSVSTDGTVHFPHTHGRRFNHWRTEFSYDEYEQPCAGVTYYWVQATQWDTGTNIKHVKGAPGTPFCASYLPHSGFTKDTTTASTVKVGFSIPAPISFSGSAQTGYTTTAAVGFHWRRAGKLCGKTNYPGGKNPGPGVIVAAGK